MNPRHVYLAVANSYDKLPDGILVPNVDSQASCDKAIELACRSIEDDWIIVTAAGKLNDEDVTLAEVMSTYLMGKRVPDNRIVTLEGKLFRTIGEMIALVEYLKEVSSVTHVTICVKYWHTARCQDILLQLLRLEGLDERVAVSVASCESDPTAETLRTEMSTAALKHVGVMWALPKIYWVRDNSEWGWKALMGLATHGYRIKYHVDPPWVAA